MRQSPTGEKMDFGLIMSSQWKEEAQHVKGYLLEITYKDLMKVSLWFMDVKCTLVTYSFGEFRLSRSHFLCAVSLKRDFSSVILITFVNGWLGFFFFFFERNLLQWFLPSPPLSAISKQSMFNCLFNAFFRILLKVRHTSRYPPQLLPLLPLHFCS